MSAGTYNLVIDQGSDFALDLVIKEAAVALDLSLYSGRSQLRTSASASSVAATFSVTVTNASEGALKMQLAAATSSALAAGHHDDPEPIAVTAETVVQAAPDNFWTLLGNLFSVGGWALLLIVLVPMVFSWLMPGPVQFKGKKK